VLVQAMSVTSKVLNAVPVSDATATTEIAAPSAAAGPSLR
jgi:hypothetical protein